MHDSVDRLGLDIADGKNGYGDREIRAEIRGGMVCQILN